MDDLALVHDFIELLALKFGDFELASGEKAPFYFDMKRALQHEKVIAPLARLLHHEMKPLAPVEAVAGVALGGCHLASIVAMQGASLNLPVNVVYVRKDAKGHGTNRLIEGPTVGMEEHIVLFEDVLTTGASVLAAARALRDAGYDVRGVVTVLDRREKRTATIGEYPLRSLFSLDDFEELRAQ